MTAPKFLRIMAAPGMAIALFAVAVAGTNCPDPVLYTYTPGYCDHRGPLYVPVGYVLKDGTCASPGSNSQGCVIRVTSISPIDAHYEPNFPLGVICATYSPGAVTATYGVNSGKACPLCKP